MPGEGEDRARCLYDEVAVNIPIRALSVGWIVLKTLIYQRDHIYLYYCVVGGAPEAPKHLIGNAGRLR